MKSFFFSIVVIANIHLRCALSELEFDTFATRLDILEDGEIPNIDLYAFMTFYWLVVDDVATLFVGACINGLCCRKDFDEEFPLCTYS